MAKADISSERGWRHIGYCFDMVSDRDIRATALIVIKQHGEHAVFYAAGRADELLEQGAHQGAVTWRLILGEIKRLQTIKPEGPVN